MLFICIYTHVYETRYVCLIYVCVLYTCDSHIRVCLAYVYVSYTRVSHIRVCLPYVCVSCTYISHICACLAFVCVAYTRVSHIRVCPVYMCLSYMCVSHTCVSHTCVSHTYVSILIRVHVCVCVYMWNSDGRWKVFTECHHRYYKPKSSHEKDKHSLCFFYETNAHRILPIFRMPWTQCGPVSLHDR